MQPNFNSSGLINPERIQRPDVYTIVRFQGQSFRVLSRQYLGQRTIVGFWCVFWMSVSLITTTILVSSFFNYSIKAPMSILTLMTMILAVYAIHSKQHLSKILTYTTINISLMVLLMSILVWTGVQMISIPTGIFILTQIALSLIYVKQYGQIILVLFVLSQLALISLKIDQVLEITWEKTLMPLLPCFTLVLAAFIFITIYTTLLRLYYQQTFQLKKYSLQFLILSLISLLSILVIPLAWKFLGFSLYVFCIPALAITSISSMCLFLYLDQISFFLCAQREEVQDKQQKQLKIQISPVQKSMKLNFLIRFSQNWFGREPKSIQEPLLMRTFPECLVCAEAGSDAVWLPCGHLALCTPCSRDMLSNGMISCILCKQRPFQIAKLRSKQDYYFGLQDMTKGNIYHVQQQYHIIIS